MSDQYEHLRSLPFPTVAASLGLDIHDYRQRKHGQEWHGKCPIHRPNQNSTSSSYAQDGRFHCFSCGAKGKGAIALIKLVAGVNFQAAVDTLGGIPAVESPKEKSPVVGDSVASSAESMQTELKPMQKDTWRKFAVPCPWLEQRIPDAAIRERYGVFCYNNPGRKAAYSGRG